MFHMLAKDIYVELMQEDGDGVIERNVKNLLCSR